MRIAGEVAVILEVEHPGLLPDLIARLAANGCATSTVDESACRVVHVSAADDAEEWYELHFFVRAWQARHGVEVSLRPDWETTSVATETAALLAEHPLPARD